MIHELCRPLCAPALALAFSTLAACGGGADEYAAEPARAMQAEANLGQTSRQARHALAASAPPAEAGAAPWRIAAHPADTSAVPGEAASFHMGAEGGSGAFEYQWLRDGELIEGATASQYSFVTALDDGGATFSLRVRPRGAGAGHERESAPATVTGRDARKLPFTYDS